MILKNGQEITTPPIDALPIGTIVPYDGEIAPTGYLICNGQAVSQAAYPELYQLLGDRHRGTNPVIEGQFYLPDLRTRVPVGYDSTNALFNSIGKNGGELEHTLTVTEMPAHRHNFNLTSSTIEGQGVQWASNNITGMSTDDSIEYDNLPSINIGAGWSSHGAISIATSGNGSPHNNMQPFQVYNYIIKAQMITIQLNKNATTYSEAYITTTSELPDNSQITSPLSYQVGNNSLAVYLMGERLVKADPSNSIDGNYIEIGDYGSMSTTIQLYNIGTTVPQGTVIQFIVTGGYNG